MEGRDLRFGGEYLRLGRKRGSKKKTESEVCDEKVTVVRTTETREDTSREVDWWSIELIVPEVKGSQE